MRLLGIPTVVDRLIQQATHQVPMPLFDPDFSEASYGFRLGRSARDAVVAYIAGGRRFVADLGLEKFFDRVNHDVLMARVACKVGDTRVLRLIRRYLQPGLMLGGLTTARTEETPQGGPLSPLLSNVLLDDLHKELERRGHAFCRYARRAGDVLDVPVPGRAAAAHGQPRQKRGRPSPGSGTFSASASRLIANRASKWRPRAWVACAKSCGTSFDRGAGAPSGAPPRTSPRSCVAGRTISGWRRPREPSRISTDGCGARFAASCGANGSDRAPEPRG